MIKSDIRKSLTTVDISQYDSVIETFSKRLEARNLAESTAFSYIGCLKIFFAWCVLYLASKAAMALDYEDFRAFIAFLEQDGLMPRTINVYIAALKQFRHFIQKESWSRYEITFKKYDRKLPRVPSTEQAGQLVDACSTNLEFLLIMLLLSTGMRISEVCALTYSDIERDDRQIYVHPGKGRSDRHVPLDDLVLEALIAYCKETIELCREAGEPIPTKDSPIFRFKDGIRPANTNFLSRAFKSINSRAFNGSHNFTPHSCRHYFALQVYLQKYDLMLVMNLLGHRSLNATEVYLRLASAMSLRKDGYINPLHLCKKPDKDRPLFSHRKSEDDDN